MTPQSLAVISGQAWAALDVQAWRAAEQLIAALQRRAPESLATQQLARQWAVHNKREWRVEVNKGLASDAPDSGGEWSMDTVVYTAPIDTHWRGFAGGGFAQGRYAEGRGRAHWQRGGVQWRSRDWWVEAEASVKHTGNRTKPGLALAAAYDVDDHWQAGGSGQWRSRETPLRALRSGISSNVMNTWLRWRAHERREWRLDASTRYFSDGNRRVSLSVDGAERLYTRPRLTLDARLGISTQRASHDDNRPYFNPKRDLMVLPALHANHVLYRRYDTVWTQHATVSAGSYRQRGFAAGGVLAMRYGQRFRTHTRSNNALDVGVTVQGSSRPYDGQREREWSVTLGMNLRF